MIHQPIGGVGGTVSDIALQAKEILDLKAPLNLIMSEYTGQTVEKIATDSERDFYMSAEEAKDYGLIDEIVMPKKEVKEMHYDKKLSKESVYRLLLLRPH